MTKLNQLNANSISLRLFYYHLENLIINSKYEFRLPLHVKDNIKGDIARIYFYMSDKYNVRLSKQERKMMESWNKLDPVDKWEILKNNRVKRLQGNKNKYINKNQYNTSFY